MRGSELIAFDGLGLLIVLIAAVTALFTSWGALAAGRGWGFYALVTLFLLLLIASTGANNLIGFYVIWEVAVFAAWGLGRWAGSGDGQTMMGPLPLQGFGALGSLGMVIALLLLALQNRSLGIQHLDTTAVKMLTVLLLGAIMLKSFALLAPAWYPARDGQGFFVAQAMLGGAGLLGIGLYPYLRFFFENLAHRSEWRAPVVMVALTIALLAALAALGEHDLPKLFAYATFSQFSGLIAFFAVIRPADMALATITLLGYVLAIVGLGLCLAAIAAVTGQRDVRHMGGLINRMPLTAALCLLCGLSLAGLPPLGGFLSRLLNGLTLFGRGEHTVAYLFFALGVATLLHQLRLFHAVFLGRATAEPPERGAPFALVTAVSALVLCLLVVGLLPGAVLAVIQPATGLALK